MIWVLGSTRRRLRSTVPDHLKEGRKLLAQGPHDAALAELNKALEISPHLGEAYFQRGCVHEARSQVDEALADFDRALEYDPQHAHAYLHRGRIRTEKGDLEPALADFDQVMIMRPNDAECYLNRGVCLAKKGLISDAILDFQRVLKLTNHSDYRGACPLLPGTARRREPAGPAPAGAGQQRLAATPLRLPPNCLPLRITCSERRPEPYLLCGRPSPGTWPGTHGPLAGLPGAGSGRSWIARNISAACQV